MNAACPTRPIMRWHGGKWLLAPWIISHFPVHRTYVEPFGGAPSVLLRKERAYTEVYNDLDDDAVNLFRCVQDPAKAKRLQDLLSLTPFARREFQITYDHTEDPVEAARRLIIRSFMGFGSNAHACAGKGANSTGFRAQSRRSGTTPAHDWRNYPDALPATIDRLRGVVIEQRDAKRVMAAHDAADTLHYVDPPYVHETRGVGRAGGGMRGVYRHELATEEHAELLAFLRVLRGGVVLSGYPHPLYDNALPGWRRIEREAHADGARPRIEVLWINPAAAAALDREKLGGEQIAMFAEV